MSGVHLAKIKAVTQIEKFQNSLNIHNLLIDK